MIDYQQLIMQLEQQTSALEAAVLQREFDLAIDIMLSRIALFEILISNPIIDPDLKKGLNESMLKIEEKEREVTLFLMSEKDYISNKLHNIMDGNKASQLYQDNR